VARLAHGRQLLAVLSERLERTQREKHEVQKPSRSDEEVANRNATVWHGATENAP
jgi:hypothetical protein